MKKYFSIGVLVLTLALVAIPAGAQTRTTAELQRQIAALTAQLNALIQAFDQAQSQQTNTEAGTALTVGDRIQVTVDGYLNVRQSANGQLVARIGQRNGALGTITDGPRFTANHTWWQVNFDTGPDGWVAGQFLAKIGVTVPTTSTQASTINYINPTSANAGATVWVYGTNFNENTYVTLDGTNVPIWPNNAPARGTGVLSFNIPSGVSSGTHTVQVGEKGSSFPLSNSVRLTVGNQTQAPTISYLNPNQVTDGTRITIYGTNLSGQVRLEFFDSSWRRITFVDTTGNNTSPTSLSFNLPVTFSALSAGSYKVMVSNQFGNSNVVNFDLTSSTQTQTQSVSVTNTSSSATPIDNGINPVSKYQVTYNFTLVNSSSNDIFLSKNTNLSIGILTYVSGGIVSFLSPGVVLAGDTQDVFVVPSGSQRSFVAQGQIVQSNGATSGSQSIHGINYGLTSTNPDGYYLTSGLENLSRTVTFSGSTQTPTITVTNTSSSAIPVVDGSGSVNSYKVSYNFTLVNNGSRDIYIRNHSSGVSHMSVIPNNYQLAFSVVDVTDSLVTDAVLPGDTQYTYIIPAGKSRHFIETGFLKRISDSITHGTASITKIFYDFTSRADNTYSITTGLENLSRTVTFSGSTQTPTISSVEEPAGKHTALIRGTGLLGARIYFNGSILPLSSHTGHYDVQIGFLPPTYNQGTYPIYVVSSSGQRSNTVNLVITSATTPPQTGTTPTITVTSPGSGVEWTINSVNRISWSPSVPSNVVLSLIDSNGRYTDGLGQEFFTISQTSYNWTIPSSLVPGNYTLKANLCPSPHDITYCLNSNLDSYGLARVSFRIAGVVAPAPTVSAPTVSNVQIQNNQNQWVNRSTSKTVSWNYLISGVTLTSNLKFKVGLYSDLNGGIWGNNVLVPVSTLGRASSQSVNVTPSIGSDWFNKDYYIRVRLVNADGTDYRHNGARVEARSSQTFQVVASAPAPVPEPTSTPASTVGPNLLINGDFSSGVNNWIAQGIAQKAVGSGNGTLVITNDGSNSPYYYLRRQTVTVEPGAKYEFGGTITANLDSKVGTYNLCQIDLYIPNYLDTNDITQDQSGTQTFTRTVTVPAGAPTSAQVRLLTGYALNGTCTYDNVFLRKVSGTVSEVEELNQMASALQSLQALLDALR